MNTQLIDSTEAATILGKHPATVLKLTRLGVLPATRISKRGRGYRYQLSQILSFLKLEEKKSAQAAQDTADRYVRRQELANRKAAAYYHALPDEKKKKVNQRKKAMALVRRHRQYDAMMEIY